MYHIAKSLLYNDADCADAIQEAIVKAFAKLHTLKDDSYAKTWLIRIVMNECYAIMRKEKKIISLQVTDERAGNGTKDYSDLYEAIFHLPEQNKTVRHTVLYGRVQCERGRSIVRYDRECSKKQAWQKRGEN